MLEYNVPTQENYSELLSVSLKECAMSRTGRLSSSVTITCNTREQSGLQTQGTAHPTSHTKPSARTDRPCRPAPQSLATTRGQSNLQSQRRTTSPSRNHITKYQQYTMKCL